MIRFTHGNIFTQPAEAIVNPVNCVGVMGRGLALQFKRRYPEVFHAYRIACRHGTIRPGRVFVHPSGRDIPRWILHFPTKRHWRDPSSLEDIRLGLADLAATVILRRIRSIALPSIGCGLGGLRWLTVRPLIEAHLNHVPCLITVLEPSATTRDHGITVLARNARDIAPPALPAHDPFKTVPPPAGPAPPPFPANRHTNRRSPMSRFTALNVLIRARSMIANPATFVPFCDAHDAQGFPIAPTDPSAATWSDIGAIHRAAFDIAPQHCTHSAIWNAIDAAMSALDAVIGEPAPASASDSVLHRDALASLTRAIEHIRDTPGSRSP